MVGGLPGHKRVYRGPGSIRQKEDHGFEVKIYATGKAKLSDTFSVGAIPAGTLVGKRSVFRFRAFDGRGRVWEGTTGRPDTNVLFGHKGYFVSGQCEEITSTEKVGVKFKRPSLSLRAFREVKFPRNAGSEETLTTAGKLRGRSLSTDAAKFDVCDLGFLLRQDGDTFELDAQASGNSLPARIETRVDEALRFVLATQIPWSLIVRCEAEQEVTTVRSPSDVRSRSRLQPPLRFTDLDDDGKVWHLFGLYLSKIAKHVKPRLHPLSGQIGAVFKAAEGSIEAEALTLGVAVESVLKASFPRYGRLGAKTRADLKALSGYLAKWTQNPSLVKRIQGSLGGMARASASDRLFALVTKGMIAKDSFDAWKRLRNSVAHGDWPSKDLQIFVDLCGQMTVLLYQLIFLSIEYKGTYTDYGTRGYPSREYPPS
jgi:hypothetical protein